MGSQDEMPYWHYNVPEHERTPECPVFLQGLTDKDRGIIGSRDEDYHISTWDEVREIVRTNHLEQFKRIPSELRRYKAYTHHLAKTYGSVATFMLNHRLGWSEPVEARGAPFQYPEDWKIICNDWPYGIDPRIVHVNVWTKFRLEVDPATGDLTDKARSEIDAFVTKTFRSHVPDDNIIWFKNWRALMSVEAVEHFHVMMFDPDPEFIRIVTNGDMPRSRLAQS